MGSSWFYLEYLIAIVSILQKRGYKNPAIFALKYTLVPDQQFPVQIDEALRGYQYILDKMGNSERCILAGDSAGASIVLSLLLHLSRPMPFIPFENLPKPGYAILISPWPSLVSPKHSNTDSDFIDAEQLHHYGRLYAGDKDTDDPYVSPGQCEDIVWWKEAMPSKGMFFIYGSEEVLADDVRGFVDRLKKVRKIGVSETETIHAWPVVQLFLGESRRDRQCGLWEIVDAIQENVPP